MLDNKQMYQIEITADDLILSNNKVGLIEFVSELESKKHLLEPGLIQARYYYALANCYSTIHRYIESNWFSEDLNKAVINYRRALYSMDDVDIYSSEYKYLRACIETNLGNWLSSQGRLFCCIPYWDSAIELSNNPVAIISKANNQLFIAQSIYDDGHIPIHYLKAYELICIGLESKESLDEEHKAFYSDEGKGLIFKNWFETQFSLSEFDCYDEIKNSVFSKKHDDYLRWCANKRLFLNDLNDVDTKDLVCQDILTVPNITQKINTLLMECEELIYHGGFEEIKNDYCYARYLFFCAHGVPNDQEHFLNATYPHIDDRSYAINNLKSNHYKSAFRILYSIFDKIAYFMNSFFDLHYDRDKVSFHGVFGKYNPRDGTIKPHEKLVNSDNYFIHALFYILKDIREPKIEVNSRRPRVDSLDPDSYELYRIRNAIEHRSIKIADDTGFSLNKFSESFNKDKVKDWYDKIESEKQNLSEVFQKIKAAKKDNDNVLKEDLEQQKINIQSNILKMEDTLLDKNKRSDYSLVISVSEFESRLLTLIRLVRNSIMYLSLSIHYEESKSERDEMVFKRDVPLK